MAQWIIDQALAWTRLEHLTREVGITLGCIAITLVIASVLVRLLRRWRPSHSDTELLQRVRTWWVIAWMFGLGILMSPATSTVFLGFVSFLALKEYLSLIPTRRADRRVLFWAYLSIPVQYYLAYIGWYEMFVVFIPVYVFLFLPARMVIIGQTEGFLRSVGTLHWGLMATVFSLSHTAMLLMLNLGETPRIVPTWPNKLETTFPGVALLVLLIVLTQFNDVAQYLWGKTCGRKRIAPLVSPGKTWAGLIGGIASTVLLAGLLGPWLTILDLQRALFAGALISISGFAGDLSISALKRDPGVKDSGSLLPGHGGILDRVDSLTYTAPLFFHFLYFFYG